MHSDFMTTRLDRAFRWAAECHAGQVRKSSGTPYFQHVAAVALILERADFDEDIVIAGLLHDVVEDSDATIEDVTARFGPAVAEIVGHCSEAKTDAQGRKRPWIDRKRDHLAVMADAPLTARAVILADKLHNLVSIEVDLHAGRPVWSEFHAEREQVLWYYRSAVSACGYGDWRVEHLALACNSALSRIELIK
jgi:(p)ppGpp synthase/HD superfamily hydrolase